MDSSTHYSNKPHKHRQPSPAELLSSAKVVAGAAKSSFGGGGGANKIDRAKVAEAAEDLLAAASNYGKLEERGYGSYIEKAEGYLHQYNSSNTTAATTNTTTAHRPPKPHEEEGGIGDYLKLAQGFMKKH